MPQFQDLRGAICAGASIASILVVGSATAGVVTGDVVAAYDFDETSGTTFADRTGGLDGVTMDNVELNVNGISGDGSTSAIRFWPTADGPGFAVVPHQDKFEIEEGFLSFNLQDDNFVLDAGVLSKDAKGFGNGGHLSVFIRDSKLLVRLQSDSASFLLTSESDVLVSTWHQIQIGFGPSGMALYFDGVLEDSNEFTGGLVGNTEPLVIGASQAISRTGEFEPLAEFWSGTLDQIEFVAVPEPASAALLGLGALCVTRRRRSR